VRTSPIFFPASPDLEHGLMTVLELTRRGVTGGRSSPKHVHVRPVHPVARDAPASRVQANAPFLSAAIPTKVEQLRG